MSTMIVSPEFEKLKEKRNKLKTELSMILLEYDELRFVECKNIESDYMMKLGAMEFKTLKKEYEYRRLKRKIQLIQAKLNHHEKVDFVVIEMMLERELDEFHQEVERKWNQLHSEIIKRQFSRLLSEGEIKELKALYRKIMKALHPDLNPNPTKRQIQLLEEATLAYKNGDIQALQVIYSLIEDEIEEEDEVNVWSEIEEQIQRLEDAICNVKEKMEEVKGKYPYTMKELLKNKEEVEKKRKKFKEEREQYQKQIQHLNEELDHLMKEIYGKEVAPWAA